MKLNKRITFLLTLTGIGMIFASCGGTPSSITSSFSSNPSSTSSSSSSSSIEDVPPPPIQEDKERTKLLCDLPYVSMSNSLDMMVSLCDTIDVKFRLKSSENINPTLTYELDSKEETITSFEKIEEGYEFTIELNSILDSTKSLSASFKNGTNKILSITVSVEEYIKTLLDDSFTSSELDGFDFYALDATAISFINYLGSIESYYDVSAENLTSNDLTNAQRGLLYNSLSQNIYHADWGNRDNLTISGEAKEGFTWKKASLNFASAPALRYTFGLSKEYTSLKAKYLLNNQELEAEVYKLDDALQVEQDVTLYYFDTEGLGPVEYSSLIEAEIYDGNNLLSNKAGFSLTRAIAYVDIYGNEVEKNVANALYSYAKSSTWFAYKDEVSYDILPAVNDNGISTCEIGEYTYDDSRMLISTAYSAWGTFLYTSGNVSDSNHPTIEEEGYSITYANNKFTIILDGASLDGIMVKHGAELEIIVKGDSSINGSLYRSWDDKNAKVSGSIITDTGNITIRGENDATLSINGSIVAPAALSFEDSVNVEISSHKSGTDALNVNGNLSILEDSNVETTFIGVRPSSNASIDIKGNVEINNSSFKSVGFDLGVYLGGEVNSESSTSSQTLNIQGESNFYIESNLYGINSHSVNRELSFMGGNTYIKAGTGINYGNVTIGDVYFECVAKQGYVIQASAPVTFNTTSGDYQKGIIKLINQSPYNQWWDVEYVLKVSDLNIDGGTLYLEGNTRGGIIQTEKGSTLDFANCDTYITSHNDGNGINAGKYNEVITIHNTARIFMKGVDIPVACWAQANDVDVPVSLYIYGDFVVDSYRGAIGEWGDTTSIKAGFIRYTNKRES